MPQSRFDTEAKAEEKLWINIRTRGNFYFRWQTHEDIDRVSEYIILKERRLRKSIAIRWEKVYLYGDRIERRSLITSGIYHKYWSDKRVWCKRKTSIQRPNESGCRKRAKKNSSSHSMGQKSLHCAIFYEHRRSIKKWCNARLKYDINIVNQYVYCYENLVMERWKCYIRLFIENWHIRNSSVGIVLTNGWISETSNKSITAGVMRIESYVCES